MVDKNADILKNINFSDTKEKKNSGLTLADAYRAYEVGKKNTPVIGARAKDVPGIVTSWKPIATKEESDGGDNKQDSGNDGLTSGSVILGGTQGEAKSGAMSYEDYLKNYGADTTKNYLASVKQANDDYYRSLMTYGMNAEALASGGMTGAGVSSYGTDAAWAARQGAVSYAGAVKQVGDTENAKNYFDYVQTYNVNQEKATAEKNKARSDMVNSLITSGITDAATIKLMLGQTGNFTAEEIETIGNQIASGATSVVAEADVTAAEEIFANGIAGGLGLEAAKLAVSQKYGDDVATTVMKNNIDIVKTQIDSLVSQMDGKSYDEGAKAALDTYKKQGYLTEEEYNAHLATLQESNATYLGTLFEQARDQYDADKVLVALGIEVAEGADEATIMAEATKAAREALMQAHDNGAITTAKAVDIMTGDFANEIEAVTSSEESKLWLQHVCDKLLVWEDYSGELGTDALYKNILQFVTEEITFGEPDRYSLPLSFGGKRFFIVYKDKVLNPSDDGKITYQHMTKNGTANITMEPNESQMLRTIYNVWTVKNNEADAYVAAATGN